MRRHPLRNINPQAQSTAENRGAARRSGAVLMTALVILAIVGSILGLMIKTVTLQARQVQSNEYRQQAYWLADSAIDRAVAQRVTNADYQGETWQVEVATASKANSGVAEISLSNDASRPGQTLISVTADYPAEGQHRVRSLQRVWVGDRQPPTEP